MAADWVVGLAKFVHVQDVLSLAILLIFAWFFFPRKKMFLISLAGAGFVSFLLKELLHQARPCVQAVGLVPCPADFGYPSIHAAISGILIMGSVGSPAFWIFAPLGLFVGYSRVVLGVHSPEQVLAGFALAFVAYLLAWLHVKKHDAV